ncbi:hypothetical protein F5Y07DRAFT_283299 [Xylaria sp. FL0933]|nr:hypothetical protein F5Y07DRAFT_283299 [Xylaria sp. FL0933]
MVGTLSVPNSLGTYPLHTTVAKGHWKKLQAGLSPPRAGSSLYAAHLAFAVWNGQPIHFYLCLFRQNPSLFTLSLFLSHTTYILVIATSA